jgi:8-oxo-dGTP pyrophosphatase MutT (NUDIX family)
MKVEQLSSEYLSRHPYFTARKDAYRLPDGKTVDQYFVVELPPCVVAMALNAKGDLLLVKQYRYPVDEVLLELPGGFIDGDELPEQAVRRELLEETGYAFKEIRFLGSAAANPGVLNNLTHFFLAMGGERIQDQHLDPNESIQVEIMPMSAARQLLLDGGFKQSLHALCLFYGFEYLQSKV